MRIVCPACDAVYEVPDSLLGAEARALRCARCGHEWVPRAEAVAGGPLPDVPIHDAPLPDAPPPDVPLRRPVPASLAERAAERVAERDAASLDNGVPRELPPPARRPPLSRLPEARVPESRVPTAPPAPSESSLTIFPPLVGRPERSRGSAAALGWVASVLVLAAILAAAYVWRAEVQAAWPPSQRAYAAIGLR